jgi:hypothetical protein
MKKIKHFAVFVLWMCMLSSNGGMTLLSQNRPIQLTEKQSREAIEYITACDFIQREVVLLRNTMRQNDVMLQDRKETEQKLLAELVKRDDVIARKDFEFDKLYQVNQNLRKQMSFFSWLNIQRYLGVALVSFGGGYLYAKNK